MYECIAWRNEAFVLKLTYEEIIPNLAPVPWVPVDKTPASEISDTDPSLIYRAVIKSIILRNSSSL